MAEIGLPPPKDQAPRESTPEALRFARFINLFGLLTPAANLGLLWVGPRDQRWFGLFVGLLCGAAMTYGRWRGMPWLFWTAAYVHYAFVLFGLVNPLWVARIGVLWSRFGMLIGKVMAYPIFTVIYVLVVTPTSLLVRVFGKDPLGRKDPPAETYWTPHKPTPKESYERQF
jgi:hypothetical protein